MLWFETVRWPLVDLSHGGAGFLLPSGMEQSKRMQWSETSSPVMQEIKTSSREMQVELSPAKALQYGEAGSLGSVTTWGLISVKALHVLATTPWSSLTDIF